MKENKILGKKEKSLESFSNEFDNTSANTAWHLHQKTLSGFDTE